MNESNEMYKSGYDSATVCFGYIPDFANDAEKDAWAQGYKDGKESLKS